MTDTNQDALKAWVRSFLASDDNGDQDDDQQERQVVAHDDGRDEERRFVAALFTPDDPTANVIAGLFAGKNVGRTTPPRT